MSKFKTTDDKNSGNSIRKMTFCLCGRYTLPHRTGFVPPVLNIKIEKIGVTGLRTKQSMLRNHSVWYVHRPRMGGHSWGPLQRGGKGVVTGVNATVFGGSNTGRDLLYMAKVGPVRKIVAFLADSFDLRLLQAQIFDSTEKLLYNQTHKF